MSNRHIQRGGRRLGLGPIATFTALLGLVLAAPTRTPATTFDIQAGPVGATFKFVPDDLTIHVGDTVIWTCGPGGHSVTSGTGVADPLVGSRFDQPIDGAAHPTFQFTFDTVGEVPYFCRPHEFFNMKGIIRVQALTAVDAGPLLRPSLSGPYPNPFNPRTSVELSLPVPGRAFVGLYDIRGQVVAVLADQVFPAGTQSLTWSGTDREGRPVASGLYLTRLVVDGREQSGGRYRLVLLR